MSAYEIEIFPHDPLNPGFGYRLRISRDGSVVVRHDGELGQCLDLARSMMVGKS